MAKEMIIIFVYDTQLKTETDDLSSAILYFHPHWVSDQQRTALCGQIMGTFHCLKTIFASPNIISLQSGKFFVEEYGSYILAIGTDRNVDDWVLEYRAETISSLIQLFHNDLEVMADCSPKDIFMAKLYHMLETYLKILIYSGNIFCNMPTLQLPKSASNVFLEAIEILQTCQGIGHVLGGTILYHNKVVATQLRSNLTKKLVLTDPYRIKSPAEVVNVNYQLPLGVQLLKIYIRDDEYEELLDDSDNCRNINQYCKNKIQQSKKAMPITKENVLSAMKRDQSLIFTTVPEEDNETQSPVKIENITLQSKPLNRPKFLNLRNKTTDFRTVVESTNESKTVPITPFHGQTSVCSTPMTDLNKVLHQKVMSICVDPQKDDGLLLQAEKDEENKKITKTESLNSVLSAISETSDVSAQNKESVLKSAPYMKIVINNALKSYKSLLDLTQYEEFTFRRKRLGSVSDPTFPVTSTDDKCVSRHLYDLHMKEHIVSLNNEANENRASESNTEEWKSIEDIDAEEVMVPINKNTMNLIESNTSKEQKKALTLPLKSFNDDSLTSPGFHSTRNFGGVQLTPLMTKLSLLANEERSSGFCSIVTTPSEYKDYVKSTINMKTSKSLTNIQQEQCNINKSCDLRKAALFVCGQQDMVVILVMEEDGCFDKSIVYKLWDNCIEYLGKVEKQLRQCLEMCPGNSHSGNVESYSYLCMNSEWNTVQRGGPWGAMELGSLTHMHRDFCDNNLTEIILRDDEGVIYGHQLGRNEVYYHQLISNNHSGLPTPADPMGTVPLKAKRRLERDHAIILL